MNGVAWEKTGEDQEGKGTPRCSTCRSTGDETARAKAARQASASSVLKGSAVIPVAPAMSR